MPIWWQFHLLGGFTNVVYSLFHICIRELLHTKKRKDETIEYLTEIMGDAIISIDIELVGPEITACSQAPPFLPTAITEDVFDLELPDTDVK